MYRVISDSVMRISDGASFPRDPNNRDFKDYLAWQAEGNSPDGITLSEARQSKSDELSSACKSAITSGISSSILGASYTYPTMQQDQANLAALVLNAQVSGSAYTAKFWCASATGIWARREHTAAQLIELGQEMTTHIQAQQDHYEVCLARIAAATTVTEVEAITW